MCKQKVHSIVEVHPTMQITSAEISEYNLILNFKKLWNNWSMYLKQ